MRFGVLGLGKGWQSSRASGARSPDVEVAREVVKGLVGKRDDTDLKHFYGVKGVPFAWPWLGGRMMTTYAHRRLAREAG